MNIKDFSNKSFIKTVVNNPAKYAKESDIKEIVEFLTYLSDMYYNYTPVVDDSVYDIIYEILKDRDPTNPFFKKIGSEVKENGVKLPYEMSSLDKCYINDGFLKKWMKKFKGPYIIMDKLDGMSVQIYNKKMYSQGDGKIGSDITHLAKHIQGLNLDKIPKNLSIRGELVVSKEDFIKVCKIKNFANERSAAGSIINTKNVNHEIAKFGTFVSYGILSKFDGDQKDMLLYLEDYKLKTCWYTIIDDDYENLEEHLAEILEKRKKDSKYLIDGLVCYNLSKNYNYGFDNPKFGFAFKINSVGLNSKVIEVIWTNSKYGVLKPRVSFEPIVIDGSTINFATGHNAAFIRDNKIGPGAIINVIKSGDVIPYINKVLKPAKEPQFPDVEYVWNDTNIDIIYDDESDDENINIKQNVHFFKTLGVKYISEGIISKLYDEGFTDIFKIISSKEKELSSIEGLGSTIIKKIKNEINEKLSQAGLAEFMAASLVFDKGLSVKKFTKIVDSIPNILIDKINKKELYNLVINIQGFSEITTTQFTKNYHLFEEFITKLSKIINISHLWEIKNDSSEDENLDGDSNDVAKKLFDGSKVVLTGFRSKILENIISKSGGSISSSVSSKTTILITKDHTKKSSSYLNAEKFGIKIFDKQEIEKLLGISI